MNYIDGFLGPVEAWEKFSQAIPSGINTNREVYILDFSLPRSVMDKLFEISNCVVWLDHHKTAFEMMGVPVGLVVDDSPLRYMVLDNNKSGAYLAWEYFHPGTEVPMFIKHIDDYDRWQFKLRGTKAFNKALWSYAPWNFEQWKELVDDHDYGQLFTEGTAILRAHDQNVQSVLKAAARECQIHVIASEHVMDTLPWEFSGTDRVVPGLSANCPSHLTSDVGHGLATQSGTFGLCWALGKDGTVANCSLRSNGDYDVSTIAKSFGGGGHRNAAGFQVDIQVLLGWLK